VRDSGAQGGLAGIGRDDYSLGRVPGMARRTWQVMAVQRFAQLSTPTQLLVGAALGMGMSFGRAVLAITLGSVILEAVIIVTGVVAVREGLSTTLLARWTGFGSGGSAVVSLVIAITSAGWFGVQDSILAQSLASTPGGPLWAWCVAGGALVTVLALRGFAVMSRAAFVTVPGFLCLAGYMVYQAQRGHLLSGPVAPALPHAPLSLGAGATVVAGGFILGAVLAPDMTRFSRSGTDVVRQTVTGVTAGQYLTCLTGVLLAHAADTAHIVPVVVRASGVAGVIIIVTAVVTVNTWNLYSASLAAVNAVDALLPGRRASRPAVTIIMGAAGSPAVSDRHHRLVRAVPDRARGRRTPHRGHHDRGLLRREDLARQARRLPPARRAARPAAPVGSRQPDRMGDLGRGGILGPHRHPRRELHPAGLPSLHRRRRTRPHPRPQPHKHGNVTAAWGGPSLSPPRRHPTGPAHRT
jgi:purine-cytosine permease-like protein